VPFTGHLTHFFLHHQAHQSQSGFSEQVPDALLQKTDDLAQRQRHLNARILLCGKLAKLVHRSLLLNLIPSLHSDSLLFLGRKIS
jgi:hypothetical protein